MVETFTINYNGVKAEFKIQEPIYPTDLRLLADEIDKFYKFFWENSEENWQGVTDNIPEYIKNFQEECFYLINIALID